MRETIFISHATPEDNEFTIWLASKLELLGYEVWIDKDALIGGEKFWEEIDSVIRNKAIKFLLVYSENILQKDHIGNRIHGKLKNGVYKEFSLAESISSQKKLHDFIQLLNIDGSIYNMFIGADQYSQISFHENWAEGLRQLLKKLERDKVHKSSSDTTFHEWYKSYLKTDEIKEKNELYYSNWWEIPSLPRKLYLYQFKTQKLANEIYKLDHDFPVGKITNVLSSFQKRENFIVHKENENLEVKPQRIFEILVSDIFLETEFENYPNKIDRRNHFIVLLKRVFHMIMKNRRMFWYEMSNKRLAYFYTPANLKTLKTRFQYLFRRSKRFKTKNLIGKHKSLGKWHYAVSCKPNLKPVLCFSLKSHLTFTSDGFEVWKDKNGEVDSKKIHSQRRAKGRRFFNEEWRDMLLAFIQALKKEDKILIDLNENFTLEMPSNTMLQWANFGYIDPKEKDRHDILSFYEQEEILTEDDIDELPIS